MVEGPPIDLTTLGRPAWIELPADGGEVASPTIRGSGTSRDNPTGLWRTLRPVIHEDRCRRCWWLCATFCPDGAVLLDDRGWPQIDYTHCKGCSLCASQCPHHAIELIPESLEEVGWAGGAP